jgi:hypothetical protein
MMIYMNKLSKKDIRKVRIDGRRITFHLYSPACSIIHSKCTPDVYATVDISDRLEPVEDLLNALKLTILETPEYEYFIWK